LAGIRGRNPAGVLVAVERERIGADIFAPEGVLETFGELRGTACELARSLRETEAIGAP
jgi:hypothetical protein